MQYVWRMLTGASERVSHLFIWRRHVRATTPRRPLFPTFVWFMISGALADLTIVVSLVFDLRIGGLALLCCLVAATVTVRSPYRWRRWHKSRNGKDTSSHGSTEGPRSE